MSLRGQSFVRATLVLIGTVIGAGIFALPAAFRASGLVLGSIIYWVVALVVMATHMLYADVVLSSPAMLRTRFFGQIKSAFGIWMGRLAGLTHGLQIIGACLAYIILGGNFLAVLAPYFGWSGIQIIWQVLFWCLGALLVLIGLSFMARVEAWLTWALLALLSVSIGLFAMRISGAAPTPSSWGGALSMLGVALFALFGYPVIPELAELCRRNRRMTRLAVVLGSFFSALVMWLFGVFAYLGSGVSLTADPAELTRVLPHSYFWLIPAVGFLAVLTSFITLAEDLMAMFHLDLKLPRVLAWLAATGCPVLFLLLIKTNFLSAVEFVGAVFSSLNGILIVALALKLMRRDTQRMFWWKFVGPSVCAAVFCFALISRILN